MARALRRTGLSLALPAIVGASTILHWLAGRRIPGLWIMPDEAIYAERAISVWRNGSLPLLHGAAAGYGVIYPAVAGLPLAGGPFGKGYAALKLLQALVVSLAAVPVFFYGRRWMRPSYAAVAAALTVCSPTLLYSGLVMTEVVFYPVAALALLAVARAVETGRRRDQWSALILIGLAVLTRAQALVFLAVFAAAVVLDALVRRAPRRTLAFVPLWAACAVAVVLALARPGLLGAYAGTISSGYPLRSAFDFSYYHLADAVLVVGVIPAAALVVLAVESARGRVSDGTRAVVCVAVAATALVCLQVGFFAARYAAHLLERDLAALPPLFFVVFLLWFEADRPRPRLVAAVSSLAVLAVLAFAPWNRLVDPNALPDSFGLAPLYRGYFGAAADAVSVAGALLLLAFVLLPRRAALALPAAVGVLLVGTSVVASNVVSGLAAADQPLLVGSPENWIDRAVRAPVTYVYAGTSTWNVVWQQRFWNRRVRHVVSLEPNVVPGPMAQRRVRVGGRGLLPTRDRYVLAANRLSFVGQPVAQHALGADAYPLVLWRLDGPPQLSLVTQHVQPNGDMVQPGIVTVYACRGGTLELTLLPKATSTVEVLLDHRVLLRRRIAGLASWHGTVPVPAAHRGDICTFTIRGGLLLGSTSIAFSRPD